MVTLQAAIAAIALSGIGQTVLLDFYSDSCGPCRQMNPTVQAMIDAGYPVQRVNVNQNARLAAKYGVHSWPCFVMIVDGREVDRQVGLTSQGRLVQMCKMGAAVVSDSRSAPMLAENSASAPQPIPPSASWPPSSALPASSNEPWNPSIPAQPVSMPLKPPAAISDAALLAASVRLRIKDPDGRFSCGSGTIIDGHGDEALILTCGHLFRDSQGNGRITVDLFGSGSSEPRQVEGRLVSYDLARDVGLVAIRAQGPVTAARLAPPDYQIAPGITVASVGCNNGDSPTVQHSHVAEIDKYRGLPNIEVAGQPVEGRSGGGLFSSEGYVIGVCNCADPKDKEGLFAPPTLIYAELDRDKLEFVYKSPGGNPSGLPAAVAPFSPAMPGPMSSPTDLASLNPPLPAAPPSMVVPASANEPAAVLPAHEQAALDEIRQRAKEGAEVVCIVRPRGNPEARSEVIMLDHVSPEFVRQISADGQRQAQPYPTSLTLPVTLPNRKILLEWSKPAGSSVPHSASTGVP